MEIYLNSFFLCLCGSCRTAPRATTDPTSVELCIGVAYALYRATPVVHDQDLHTTPHEFLELAVQIVMDDSCLVVKLGDLKFGKPMQLFDQVLQLFM